MVKNKYITAKEKGIKKGDPDWPQQAKERRPMTAAAKIKFSETLQEKKAVMELNRILEESDNDDTKLKAIKLVLDKTVPTLSAVDQTVKDVTENMSEEAMIARLRELVTSNPELLSKILADNARGKEIKAA